MCLLQIFPLRNSFESFRSNKINVYIGLIEVRVCVASLKPKFNVAARKPIWFAKSLDAVAILAKALALFILPSPASTAL